MSNANAKRKSIETQRKALEGIYRRSFWLNDQNIAVIQKFKEKHKLKTNDEAIQLILKSLDE